MNVTSDPPHTATNATIGKTLNMTMLEEFLSIEYATHSAPQTHSFEGLSYGKDGEVTRTFREACR